MNMKVSPFSGRVVFDHLPRTAGQSVSAWLRTMLGTGSATVPLIGEHRALLRRYGGEYPIICGHVAFRDDGFDPRYKYWTVLREPRDRAVSWIFYLLNNSNREFLSEGLWIGAKQFIESGGANTTSVFEASITAPYVRHLCTTRPAGGADELSHAKKMLSRYDLIGFYEDLPAFVLDVSNAVGARSPAPFPLLNESSKRLRWDELAPGCLKKIDDLIALDIELYGPGFIGENSSERKGVLVRHCYRTMSSRRPRNVLRRWSNWK